jgi:transcriptional regulator with GAF, ATPase, and Fis domain
MATGPLISLDADVLPSRETAAAAASITGPTSMSLDDAERRHIEAVLTQTGGVIEGPAGAATILNLHPNTLRSRMKKLGVTRR